MVGDVTSGGPLSVEDMLARSASAVKSGNTSANQSAVQKLLAQRDAPLEDTVSLSPVQKILAAQEKEAADKQESYFDSDAFLRLKINQLRGQLALYSTLPGLDPNGAVMGGIEAEIKGIIQKQQATLKESQTKADEAKAKLEEQERLKAAALPSPETLLARVGGTEPKPAISKEAQAMLDKVRLDTTA